MDDKSKSTTGGSRPDNPQEGKTKSNVGKIVILDWWTSTTKQKGVICSGCVAEHKDYPRHQQLWQWKKEWLCSECWDEAIKDESVDEAAAKKARHSSWD